MLISGDDYLNQLLEVVEKKRELSIKEYARTDIYSEDDINQVNIWYSQLKLLIHQNPPQKMVKCIDIYGKENRIVRIQYINADSDDDLVSFRFFYQDD